MKLITVTPAGRRDYLEILTPYLLQNRQHIHEHHFWVNTNAPADVAYLESLAQQYPDFFKLKRRPVHDVWRICDSIWHYFQDYVEDDAVYIRFDDDICYIAPEAIPRLVEFRLAHPEPFLVYGNIVNNAICSYYQQQRGLIPRKWGTVTNTCLDQVGWENGRFAYRLHKLFLEDIKRGAVARWEFPPQVLEDYRRFSINVICWFGRDLKGLSELSIANLYTAPLDHPLTGEELDDEESVLTEYLPAKFRRPAVICGNAVFSHLAFRDQRAYLEVMTSVLEEYHRLADPAGARNRADRGPLHGIRKAMRALASRDRRGRVWRAAWPELGHRLDELRGRPSQRGWVKSRTR